MHDENGVGALNGGEAMGDQDAGSAFHHALERAANAKLGVGVDAGGGFVEDEDAGIVGERAGKIDELFLAGREGIAALLNGLVEFERAAIR